METTTRRTRTRDGKTGVVIMGILFALGGVAGVGYGINTLLEASQMKSWPTAEAVITASRIRMQGPRGGGGTSTAIAEITYRYEVDGRPYVSDRVTTAKYGSSNSSRAYGQVRRYPSGARVMAHYNPADASECVLEVAWDRIYGLALAAGTAGLLLGFFMLRNAVRG